MCQYCALGEGGTPSPRSQGKSPTGTPQTHIWHEQGGGGGCCSLFCLIRHGSYTLCAKVYKATLDRGLLLPAEIRVEKTLLELWGKEKTTREGERENGAHLSRNK